MMKLKVAGLDSSAIRKESDTRIERIRELLENGDDYVADKEAIEEAISRIEASTELSEDEKKTVVDRLMEELERKADDYSKEVVDPISDISKELDYLTEGMETRQKELQETEKSLIDTSAQAKTDIKVSDATIEISKEEEEFRQMQKEYLDQQAIQLQILDKQRRDMTVRRISGR